MSDYFSYPVFENTIRFRRSIFGKLIVQILVRESLWTDFGGGSSLRWRDAKVNDLRMIYNNPDVRIGTHMKPKPDKGE